MIRCLLVAMAILACANSTAAQSTAAQPPSQSFGGPRSPASEPAFDFLPSYDFHLNMEHVSHDDPRYVWDANYGGELGIFRYHSTRLTFVANYEAVLGEEFHAFDPNQGNYILEGDLTATFRGFEIGGVFYHQSRHLADRPKRQPVDWNMLGGRIRKQVTRGADRIDARLDFRRSILTTFVDYVWELDAGVTGAHQLHPAVDLVGLFNVRHLGVDGSRNREGQTGFRAEGGLLFKGRAAAVELFLAVERRIDPYPLDFGTTRWTSVGMRLLSR